MNRMLTAASVLALAACLEAGPVMAQAAGAAAPSVAPAGTGLPAEDAGYVGQWILQQDGAGDASCPLNLTDKPAATGWAAEPLDFCPASFPVFASWALDDSGATVVLYDKGQHEVLRLQPNQDGVLESSGEPPTYQLSPYDAGGEQDTD